MEESRPPRGYTHSAVQEKADRLVLHESSAIAFTAAGSGAQAAAAGRRRSAMREEDAAAREDDQRAAAAQASINAADSCEFPAHSSMHAAGAVGTSGADEAASLREAPRSIPVFEYDSDDEPEEETGPANYLLAQAEVLNAPPKKEKRKKRKKKKKLTAQEKKELRREAQKRIVREQHARIRIRAQKYAEECAKLDAQREQEYQWQVAERKAQLHAQQLEMHNGDGGDTAGGGLHPACAGLKMRDPREFMRFYPAFTHPSFFGYKRDHAEIKDFAGAALETNARAREYLRKNPLATGGVLCVRCEGWEGLRVPKSLRKKSNTDLYALDRHPGSQGVVQYATVRLGDIEFNGIKFKNEHPADQRSVDAETLLEVGRAHDRAVAFGEADEGSDELSDEDKPYEAEDFDADPWGKQVEPGWHTWDIGAEQHKHPHKMIVKMFSGEGEFGPRRVGEADVEWVEAVANMLSEGRAKMKAEAEKRAQKRRNEATNARGSGNYAASHDFLEAEDDEEELSVVVNVPIRDRHGRAAGRVSLRIKYERRAYAAGAAKTSVKDIDILSGRAMVFGVPSDDAKRWTEADEEAEKLRLKEKVRKIKNERAVAEYEAQQALAFSDAERDSDSESDSDAEGRRGAMPVGDTKAVRPGATGAGATPSAFAVAGAAHRTELTPAEMRRYTCGMSVHPSVWGYKLTPLTTHDASLISPVFFASYLKLGDDAEIDRLGPMEQQQMEAAQQSTQNWKPRPGKQPGDCPICFTSDVPGCPGCWDFPDPTPTMRRVIKTAMGHQKQTGKGGGLKLGVDLDDPDLTANDLEPLLTDAQQRLVRSEQLKDMHTKLKRRANVVQHRQTNCSYIRFLVKGILPPGPVVEFQCEKNDHVGFLYQQYCANAGPVIWNQREVFLLVVTDVGVFLIDNTDEPEDDYHLAWTTTDRKLSDYSMFTNATTVCLLMVPSLNSRTPRVIQRYLALNADLPGGPPDCTVHVELARCENVWSSKRQYLPDNLPGDDVVQSRLVALQEKLTGMHHAIEREEAALAVVEAEARLQADWKARSRSNIGERRAYREARAAAALARRERMKENALQAAVEQHEKLQKRKLKRQRRRHSPVQETMGPTRLFLAREHAKASLARARVLARRAPGFAHRLANRGKEAIKNMYIRKLEQTILEEADERMIMDLPEPVYEVVKLQREKTFPYREVEVTRLRGRGLTMKFCLSALKLLGKPYQLPREVTPPRRQRPRSQGRYHPSKAQLAYLRRKALIHKRMSDAAEARRRAREGLQVVEREPTPPPSSDSDDGEIPTSFAGLAPPKADRSLLVKQSSFHLPIINTQCSHNT